jgi:hypothetical protein
MLRTLLGHETKFESLRIGVSKTNILLCGTIVPFLITRLVPMLHTLGHEKHYASELPNK